jgi:predicted ATP-dependent endonuclease of OLD family
MAVDLINKENILYPFDFYDDTKEVSLKLIYEPDNHELNELKEVLETKYKFDKSLLSKIKIKKVEIQVSFAPSNGAKQIITEFVEFTESIFPSYTLAETSPAKKDKTIEQQTDFDLNDFYNKNLINHFWGISHFVTFWKSAPEYLILDEIDLVRFSTDPKKISIPLKNCFDLAGISNISAEISKLSSSPVAIQNLEELLSDKVTTHINKIWPEHPVKLKFKINNSKITFLVEDKGVKFKNKTTNQRSDGFRQLISFLLTLSAENASQELANTILLLDEPETHLHPTAQLNLQNELIKLSQNENNNIVFFATHSNYMIDKTNIERCYKVFKKKNNFTKLEKITRNNTSYSEVNYEVFEIPTNDYHNELYGFLEDTKKLKLSQIPKTKKWKNEKTGNTEDVSVSTYIRHSIHHPENKKNAKFTDAELKESIELLKSLKYNP